VSAPLHITVNGDAVELPGPATIRELVERLGLGKGPVAVERNGDVVPRKEHATTAIAEGDAIEIVHFVGGG
jgi:sulfur carrier protein